MGTGASSLIAITGAVGLVWGCMGHSGALVPAPCGAPSGSAGAPEYGGVVPECDGDQSWRPSETTACNDHCRAQSFTATRCIESRHEEVLVRAPCECGPATLSPALSSCQLGQLSLVPLQEFPRATEPRSRESVSPVDGCKLELTCQVGKLTVTCDGEQDGTGTSLCDCYLDGQTLRLPESDPWPGEGAQTCHNAAPLCLQVANSKK
jgi:hypothetical protein